MSSFRTIISVHRRRWPRSARSAASSITQHHAASRSKQQLQYATLLVHLSLLESTIMFSSSVRRSLLSSRSRSRTSPTGSTSTSTSTSTRTTGRTAAAPAQRRWMGGDMPVPQSQNAPLWGGHTVAKEGWEETIYFYFAAAVVLQAAVILGAPETSIESWARPEAQARLRLAEQGQTEFVFGTHYQELEKQASLEVWNKYAERSTIPGDDDDDDDDDDDEDDDE